VLLLAWSKLTGVIGNASLTACPVLTHLSGEPVESGQSVLPKGATGAWASSGWEKDGDEASKTSLFVQVPERKREVLFRLLPLALAAAIDPPSGLAQARTGCGCGRANLFACARSVQSVAAERVM
jgi:hypothetical protein